MPWVPFTIDDIKSRLAARELETYEETATMESDGRIGIDNRLETVRVQTLAKYRGRIASNPRVTISGPVGTMPDFLVFGASVVARVALLGLNPVAEGMTDPRRDEYRDAIKELDSVSGMNPAAFVLSDSTADSGSGGCYGGNPYLDF